MALTFQVLASFLLCGICLCSGIVFAWPSSTLRIFASPNTTLHRPMTDTEIALFGSMSSVGALVGTPILGFLLDVIGRRNGAVLFSLLSVISWAMIVVSNRVEVLLTAMFVAGLGGASFLVVPVFVGEICQESIRGAMTSGTMVFFAVGMLFSYVVGGVLDYYPMVYVCLSACAVITASLTLTKESPTHLMAKGREEEAAKSIAFYRSVKEDSKEVLEELNVIRQCLNPEMDDQIPEEEKLKSAEKSVEKLSTLEFIRNSSSTRSAIYCTLVLLTASIFQGLIVLQVYAEPLFEDALPNMSANLASILLALTAVLAGFVAAYLTERAGRRPLMIYSSFGTGLSCVLLGLQLHLHWGPSWLVAVNIYTFTTLFSFGAGTVPYVITAEVFLPQVKSMITMVVIEWAWFCNSVILFIFNPLLKAIGLGPVFYIFAGVAFFTAVYGIFYLPETKGLNVYEIQNKFTKRKSTGKRSYSRS